MKSKKLHLVVVAVLLLVALYRCKKEAQPMAGTTTEHRGDVTYKKVESRDFHLSTDQLRTALSRFRRNNGNLRVTDDIYNRDSLTLDSAEFLLEAELNYQKDEFIDTFLNVEVHELIYYFTRCANNEYVSGTTLNSTFETALEDVTELRTSENRIAVIDVETFVPDPAFGDPYFKLSVYGPKGWGPCSESPFSGSNWVACLYGQVTPHIACGSGGFSSPLNGYQSAFPHFAAKLNCTPPDMDCEAPFYINVNSNLTEAASHSDNRLWNFYTTYPNHCNGTQLSASQLNSYYGNCKSWVDNYATGGKKIVPGSVDDNAILKTLDNTSQTSATLAWEITFSVGNRRCDRWD